MKMKMLEQLALAGRALWLTLRELRAGRLWTPWLVLGVLQCALLIALLGFAHPLLAWALFPFVRAIGGEPALHYPDFYRALPFLYSRADLVMGSLAGAVATGWSAWLFAAHWRRDELAAGRAWAEIAPRALTLVLAQLPFQLLVLLLTGLFDRAPAVQEGLAQRLGYLVTLGGVAGLQALFLYLPALIVLERRGLWSAFAGLPRAWARGFWAALLLGLVGLLPLVSFAGPGQWSDLLVDRGSPELVGWVMAMRLIVGLAVSFLLAGSSTLVYLGAVADQSGEEA
jgi:hypothetical protein